MKKVLALLVSIVMIFGVVAPAGSVLAADNEVIPIIYIRGNGQKIVDADGNEVICDIGDISLDGDDEGDKDKIIEAAANILLPFLTEGLLFDKWDNYGKAIYEEISPLFEKSILDGNGDPQYGTTLTSSQ